MPVPFAPVSKVRRLSQSPSRLYLVPRPRALQTRISRAEDFFSFLSSDFAAQLVGKSKSSKIFCRMESAPDFRAFLTGNLSSI